MVGYNSQVPLKPQILISIELSEREFFSRVLLARSLAERGWRVFLGSEASLYSLRKRFGPSVFFHKSLHPKFSDLKSLGYVCAVLDEEGGVTTARSFIREFCVLRHKRLAQSTPDVMFLPHQIFKDYISELPGARGVDMFVSGWPRIDTWTTHFPTIHEEDSEELLAKFGKFYLFPTSFGAGSEKSFLEFIDGASSSEVKEVREYKFHAFRRYVELISYLDKNMEPNETLVVRPHTSESEKDWNYTLRNLTNTVVSRSGDVTPWLMAAEAILTFGSTVAVQASLMGKVVVQLDTEKFASVTDSPSFELPEVAKDPSSALELLRQEDDGSGKTKAYNFLDTQGWLPKKSSACESIVEHLESFKPDARHELESNFAIRGQLLTRYIVSYVKYAAIKIGLFKGSVKKSNTRTNIGNLPEGITRNNVERALHGFRKDDDLYRFDVSELGRHLVAIEAEATSP
jgi:surface carbohydrate biosynthesis protein